MNGKEFYEKQYREKKLAIRNSFPFLRQMFKSLNIHHADLALCYINQSDKLLDVGCGSGSLAFKISEKFKGIFVKAQKI